MKLSVLGVIGVDVDERYKWKDTLFLDSGVCSYEPELYKKSKRIIKIKYTKTVDFRGARKIEEDIYACNEYVFDKEKNIKIYFEDKNTCVLESNQEVNEWLTVMLQVMLLGEGYSFVHAAAVENNKGECILLPSWGGVGKTATVAKMLKSGYKLLGDDLNILSDSGKIYGFPKKFVLYFYHKRLFPEVFEKRSIKCNSKLNEFYSLIIPSTKRILRKIPGVLAFARKHNPQSMKISPYEIFGKERIGLDGKIREIIWLERLVGQNYVRSIDEKALISKAVSVTMNEVFSDNLTAILIMCGMGLLDYDDIFKKMYTIYENAFSGALMRELCVDKNRPVDSVAEMVAKNVKI